MGDVVYIEDYDPRLAWIAWECICDRCFDHWCAVSIWPQRPGPCEKCGAPESMLTLVVIPPGDP